MYELNAFNDSSTITLVMTMLAVYVVIWFVIFFLPSLNSKDDNASKEINNKGPKLSTSALVMIWSGTIFLVIFTTFVLIGGLLSTEVMVEYKYYPNDNYGVLSVGKVIEETYFPRNQYFSTSSPNFLVRCTDGTYFNRCSSPFYLVIMYVLCCSPLLYMWVKRQKPVNISTWSAFLNKAILLFLIISLIGAVILIFFENAFFEIIETEEGLSNYSQRQFSWAKHDWEVPKHPSLINLFILPILLTLSRISLFVVERERISNNKLKTKLEETNAQNIAIEKIKRAKELKELGVISEDEFEEVLRKLKEDATKGL